MRHLFQSFKNTTFDNTSALVRTSHSFGSLPLGMREDYFGGGIVPKVATTSRHRWSLHSGAFDGARSCDGEVQ
jgi:hypothetical protein